MKASMVYLPKLKPFDFIIFLIFCSKFPFYSQQFSHSSISLSIFPSFLLPFCLLLSSVIFIPHLHGIFFVIQHPYHQTLNTSRFGGRHFCSEIFIANEDFEDIFLRPSFHSTILVHVYEICPFFFKKIASTTKVAQLG